MLYASGTALSAPARHAYPYRLAFAAATDKGRERPYNEDRYGAFADVGLFIVADGMGGAAAGDVAARMAVDLVCKPFADASAVTTIDTGAVARLVAAIEHANRCVYEAAERAPAWRGMGTTIAAMLVRRERAALAHVGDSRIYRLRDRRLAPLTEDHSLFNEFVRHGLANPDHPERFAHRNIVTRAIGAKPTVEVDARMIDIAPGDTLLLCSDGLSGVVAHAEIEASLLRHADPDNAAEDLIRRANDLGGPDNITAIVVRWDAADAGPRSTRG
jgi:protein phosphatase